jgi:hypothetical protein
MKKTKTVCLVAVRSVTTVSIQKYGSMLLIVTSKFNGVDGHANEVFPEKKSSPAR